MRIIELVGHALRPVRSDESKLIESSAAVSPRPEIIQVQSPAFNAGAAIPKEYSADGQGLFPTLAWANVPPGTKSLLLVVEDPDAPKPTPFIYER